MRYIYGPIPSRRLGQSLGVDPIPLKTCNWNCVYCQLGRSTPMTHTRQAYVPRDEVVAELEQVLRDDAVGPIDWISFVGSGEPTLHSELGWMIRAVQARTAIPVAVITNGSLLYQADVRADLAAADLVMPTVVAASEEVYRRIHRPHPEATFARLIEGLRVFRPTYTGQFWIEVMLIHGLNDDAPALQALAGLLAELAPDEVHLTLPTRPPAEPWVRPPDDDGLMRAVSILGQQVCVVHPRGGQFALTSAADTVEGLLNILSRHPMSEPQVRQTLAQVTVSAPEGLLEDLLRSGRVRVVERYGIRFWTAAQSVFGMNGRGPVAQG